MKKLFFAIAILVFFSFHPGFAQKIKNMSLYPDAITLIHTAPGYSTLVELASKPKKIVIGDQNSFKIEFVGNNIAIKPIVGGVKTNLFIFTEDEQYHCTLISGEPSDVDYLVRLNKQQFFEKELSLLKINQNIALKLLTFKKSIASHRCELSFLIQNKGKQVFHIDPHKVDLLIDGIKLEILSIYLKDAKVPPGSEIDGKLLFVRRNILPKENATLILGLANQTSLSFPFLRSEFR